MARRRQQGSPQFSRIQAPCLMSLSGRDKSTPPSSSDAKQKSKPRKKKLKMELIKIMKAKNIRVPGMKSTTQKNWHGCAHVDEMFKF